MTIFPPREDFGALVEKGNLIPVYVDVVSDAETPLTAYAKLVGDGRASFLLESVEQGGRFGRHSFIGIEPSVRFTAWGKRVELVEQGVARSYEMEGDPLHELQRIMNRYHPVVSDRLPLFFGGAVGFLSYECASQFEPTIPRAAKDDLQMPDALFLISDTLLIFDHVERSLKIVANAFVPSVDQAAAAYDAAVEKIQTVLQRLQAPVALPYLDRKAGAPEIIPRANMTCEAYLGMTTAMQEYIRAGDIFQVVPSQRLETDFAGEPLDVYRALRLVNPSPYMFCLQLGDFHLVGSSPEVHVRCEEGKVTIRPIAGTRPRQASPEGDAAMAEDLLADPKERAEHIMLVDLARNDVGRVCDYHSVKVTDFMVVERYSHVMHIVSNVEGHLRQGQTPFDVMRATFPAGTVTGAPKIRAMQIIAEQEPTCRGSYAGAVCYFGFSGNVDSCIAIRTVLLKNGKAFLQAGGGLVADSTPQGEYEESLNKARAGIKALGVARVLRHK